MSSFWKGRSLLARWDGSEFHVIPNADDDALKNLAALCQVIARRYDPAPPEHLFGFRRCPTAYIDTRTGELHLGSAGRASLALFVLIVLSSARINSVVEGDEWPYRPEPDDARHSELADLLRTEEGTQKK